MLSPADLMRLPAWVPRIGPARWRRGRAAREIRQLLMMITGAQHFPAEVYFLERMPARLVMSDIVQVLSMALTLSFLSTLYPAWRAASLDPVEALRYE